MNRFTHHDHYREFQLKRDAAMHAADQERLAALATASEPTTPSAEPPSPSNTRKPARRRLHLRRAFGLFILLIALLLGALPTFAQTADTSDPGTSEPYSPALVHYRVGYYFQLRGDHERAIEEFDAVIDGLPDWDGGYAARGDSYAAMGQYDRAIADYTSALELTPTFVSVMYMRGCAYHALLQDDFALADYQAALALVPDYPLLYRALGDLYFDQGNSGLALEAYHQYVALTQEAPDGALAERVTFLEADAGVAASG